MSIRVLFFWGLVLFVVGDFLGLKEYVFLSTGLWCVAIGTVMLILSLFLRKKDKLFCYCGFVVFLLAMGIIIGVNANKISDDNIANFIYKDGILTGTVVPGSWQKDEEDGAKFLLQTRLLSIDSENKPVSGMVNIHVRKIPDGEKIEANSTISFFCQVKPIYANYNPGGIDRVWQLNNRGIFAQASVNFSYVAVSKERSISFDLVLKELLASFKENIGNVMPANQQAIVFAMMFGGYKGIDEQTIADFSDTGLIHILSVSGTHVAIIISFIVWLCRRFKLGSKTTFLLAGLLIGFYAFLSSLSIPVVRASLMAIMILFAKTLDRKIDTGSLLGMVCLLALIYKPTWLLDISFQLSFVASAGLIYLYPPIKSKIDFSPDFISSAISLTLAVQLALAPFLATYFNQISLLSFIANIIVLPVLELCLLASLIGLPLFYILKPLGSIIFVFVSFALDIVVKTVEFLANFSFAIIPIMHMPFWLWICYYLFLFVLFGFLPFYVKRNTRIVLCSLIFAFCSLTYITKVYNSQGFMVHFIDVGQGDASLILTPNKKAILLDTGPSGIYNNFDTGKSIIVPYLKYYGVNTLDLLILSHGHKDHAGGAASIAKSVQIKDVWLSEEKQSDDIKRLLNFAANSNTIIVKSGFETTIDGVNIKVLYSPELSQKVRLENSTIIKMEFADKKFLFMGDADKITEDITMDLTEQVDVLKVAHHGSKNSSNPLFIAKTNPSLAVISVASNNSYGHPNDKVIKRFEKQGAKIARTDKDGAILVKIKDDKLYWYGYKENKEIF